MTTTRLSDLAPRWFLIFALASVPLILSQTLHADDSSATPLAETTLTGTVMDEEGNPVSGVTVEGRVYLDRRTATTDEQGQFTMDVPDSRLRGLAVVARHDGDRLMDVHKIPWQTKVGDPIKPFRLILRPSKSLSISVTDATGEAVTGANVGVMSDYVAWTDLQTDVEGQTVVAIPVNLRVHTVCAWKDGSGLDYRVLFDRRKERQGQPQEPLDLSQPVTLTLEGAQTIRVSVVDAMTDAPLEGSRVNAWLFKKPGESDSLNLSSFTNQTSTATNAEGIATFAWIPKWHEHPSIIFWPSKDGYVRPRATYELATADGVLSVRLHKLVPLRGQVVSPDKQPVPGIQIRAFGDGYQVDSFRSVVKTNHDGRFEVMARPDMLYMLVVDDETWAAAPLDGFVVKPGEPIENLDFQLRPVTRLFGRVTIGPDEKPVEGQQISSYQQGQDLHNMEDVELPNPEGINNWVQPQYVRWTTTDAEGRFEFFVGPGEFDLRGPTQLEIEKFTVTDESALEFNFHSPRPEKGPLRGQVVTGDPPRPVPHAKVTGIYCHQLAGRDLDIATDEHGRFEVTRALHRLVLRAKTKDASIAGIVEIGPDDEEVTISVAPTVTLRGRVIDEATGQPLAKGREIRGQVDVSLGENMFSPRFGTKTTTDEEGHFTLQGLTTGGEYNISVTMIEGRSWSRVGRVTPESSEDIDLGDLILKKPYQPPTLAERIEKAFQSKPSPAERLIDALEDTRLGQLHVLLVFADPQAEATQQLYKLSFKDRDVRDALQDYRLVSIPTTGNVTSAALDLADEFELVLDDLSQPRLLIVDVDRIILAKVTAADVSSDDTVDADKLRSFLQEFALPPLDARELLADALAQAKRENKRVFLQETATWCGPCWRLSRFLDAHHDLFAKDYIHIKLDHRWHHWEEVLEPLQEQPAGIPWSVILDADGNPLISSDGPDGNIGYPSDDSGIDHFLTMLRDTAIRLTEDDLQTFEDALRQ